MYTGAQLLGLAQTVIGTETVDLLRFVSRAPNAAGKLVATYAAATPIACNFQPVPRALFAQYGLDFTKEYRTLVAASDVGGIRRGDDGDLVQFQGRRFLVTSITPWFGTEGYTVAVCVDVGAAP